MAILGARANYGYLHNRGIARRAQRVTSTDPPQATIKHPYPQPISYPEVLLFDHNFDPEVASNRSFLPCY